MVFGGLVEVLDVIQGLKISKSDFKDGELKSAGLFLCTKTDGD